MGFEDGSRKVCLPVSAGARAQAPDTGPCLRASVLLPRMCTYVGQYLRFFPKWPVQGYEHVCDSTSECE